MTWTRHILVLLTVLLSASTESILPSTNNNRYINDVNNCYWKLRDTPQDTRVVHSVTQRCMQGSLSWLSPFGGIEATFKPPSTPPIDPFANKDKGRVFCYSIRQSHTQVKVDKEVTNNNHTSFQTLVSADCIRDSSVKVYAESIPNTISNIIGEFTFDYIWRTFTPFEECRRCTLQEINHSFCSSQFVSKGRIQRTQTNPHSFNFYVTKVIRSSDDVIKTINQSEFKADNSDFLIGSSKQQDFKHHNHHSHSSPNHSLHHHPPLPSSHNHFHHHSHNNNNNNHHHHHQQHTHSLHGHHLHRNNPHLRRQRPHQVTQHRQHHLQQLKKHKRHQHQQQQQQHKHTQQHHQQQHSPHQQQQKHKHHRQQQQQHHKQQQNKHHHQQRNIPDHKNGQKSQRVLEINNDKCQMHNILSKKNQFVKETTKSLRTTDEKYILTGNLVLGKLEVECLLSEHEFLSSWNELVQDDQNICLYNHLAP